LCSRLTVLIIVRVPAHSIHSELLPAKGESASTGGGKSAGAGKGGKGGKGKAAASQEV
jgi:hypothetical protein